MKSQSLSLCIAAALSFPAFAEETKPANTLDAVLVIGEKSSSPEQKLAGSVDVISREELENERVDDTSELFNKVPGVYLSRYNQGLINSDISIRGFAGDGETPHAKLLIDGIPANLHNGYSEMDQLFPLGIDSITVFKGNSDPTLGPYNIAGNYRLRSRVDTGVTELQFSLGSYDARELQFYTGLQTGKLRQNYFAGYRKSNGYRDHTSVDKYVLSGRWGFAISDDTKLEFTARASGYEGDAPGYLSLSESRTVPRSSAAYANQDGGEKNIQHLGLHLDHRFSDSVSGSAKIYWQQYERERWVRFSQAGALQNRYDDQTHHGFISSLEWKINDQWQFDAGADAEFQDVIEQRFGTIGQQRIRDNNAVLRNRDFSFETYGAFARIAQQFEGRFGWNLALRADRLDGDYVQFNAAGVPSTRSIYNFGTILQPKVNVFFKPNDGFTVFANMGRSFQHPFSADAFTAGNRNARDVSINDGWEAGFKWSPTANFEARLSYWQQKAKDEFVVVDGTAQNVGQTQRDGIDLATNWYINDRVYVWGNYTTVESEIVRPADSQRNFLGNELRGIPTHTGSLGLTFNATEKFTLRAHVDTQGSYYVNEANLGGKFGSYTLAHANLDYKTDWGKISLQMNNIFNRYFEYVFDFSADGSGTIHSPGDGRAYSLSVGFDW
jgi:iron complex outermembrane recepter protein